MWQIEVGKPSFPREPVRRSVRAIPARSRLIRSNARYDLPTVPPIDLEIGIGCKDERVCEYLRHSDEARVSQAHRHIDILLHQSQDRLFLTLERE